MDRKSFIVAAVIVVVTFLAATAIRYGQPGIATDVNFDDFPLQKGDWTGQRTVVPNFVTELLNPIDIFSATYTDRSGTQVQLLFDFFSHEGGPHSPRNCLPGSGWAIMDGTPREINLPFGTITTHRLQLAKSGQGYTMDFWYVTPMGETANDYVFKLHELATSLAFLPRNVAYISIVAGDDEASLAALDKFEQLFLPEVYSRLPFDR